jgi:hypothetical protein
LNLSDEASLLVFGRESWNQSKVFNCRPGQPSPMWARLFTSYAHARKKMAFAFARNEE